MLDFLILRHRKTPKGTIEVYPDFKVGRSKDLMVRGGAFYAIWNFNIRRWSTDEYDVQSLVDSLLFEYADKVKSEAELPVVVKTMSDYSSRSWDNFRLYISKLADNYKQLDELVTFSNTDTNKSDYVSKQVDYALEEGETPAFDRLFGTLYSDEELDKLMWAIGSVIEGSSKAIQKFFVLFGPPGTGKSTALNLIEKLFVGYSTSFEAQAITRASGGFPLEVLRDNPLVGINHEGDLSQIKDNSLLNSMVAHDMIVMNVKYARSHTMRLNTLLFIATNKPVTITDAKSGLLRRLVDVRPTGNQVSPKEYTSLVSQMGFELGAIAFRCRERYLELGRNHYDRYMPVDMMLRTNVFYNFVDEHTFEFARDDAITLTRAWELYKNFCETANVPHMMPRYKFRDELKAYWDEFHAYKKIDGVQYRSIYMGFKVHMLNSLQPEIGGPTVVEDKVADWLSLTEQPSNLDIHLSNQKAQYATEEGLPKTYWDGVSTRLSDIDTSELHYLLPTSQHVVIDFDLKEGDSKSLDKNLEAARQFPMTYAEVSKGGQGLHLHYEYDGDVTQLSRIFDVGIEVLAPIGKMSIRRRLTICNNHTITTISSGLPTKGKNVISDKIVKSERGIRTLIARNLNKEIHQNTSPSVDFIHKILTDAVKNGVIFDVSDMQSRVLHFASNSTNRPHECVKLILETPFVNGNEDEEIYEEPDTERLTFYDVEVFPNLLLVCWKYAGEGNKIQQMFNPSPEQVGVLLQHKLVGFNNRRYDNHILYARHLGLSIKEVYQTSSRIISGDRKAMYRQAYSASYLDVYDYAAKKQSLKKWQLELGLTHKELDLPWDEPVAEEHWPEIALYCGNDVETLEQLHNHLSEDYHARQILAELSGLPVNSSTLSHTAKIVFGNNRRPQSKFKYRDLSKEFPGYKFHRGVSTYRGEEVGEGGYVFSKPGIYHNVVYMDIASMHPRSIEVMELFGPYTENYSQIKQARIAIKEGRIDEAKSMFGGRLAPYLEDNSRLKELAYALKIVINIVYGMTFASFPNPFKDDRNIDNVVAKRGALFMVDLKNALLERDVEVIHIKTDSVKIANYTDEDVRFVTEFGKRYGYDFSIEGVFSRMALINNADLIGEWEDGGWEAVGARFSKPYIFKTLFSREPIELADMVEDRAVVKGNINLKMVENDGEMIFVGRAGAFVPIRSGCGGGELLRVHEEKEYAVAGTKGFLWLPLDMLTDEKEDCIDRDYFNRAVDEAIEKISELGDSSMILN